MLIAVRVKSLSHLIPFLLEFGPLFGIPLILVVFQTDEKPAFSTSKRVHPQSHEYQIIVLFILI